MFIYRYLTVTLRPIAIIINFARNYKRKLNLNGTAPLSDAVMWCLLGKAHMNLIAPDTCCVRAFEVSHTIFTSVGDDGRSLLLIGMISALPFLDPFQLPLPDYKGNLLNKNITGTESKCFGRTLLQVVYNVVNGHDKTSFWREYIKLCIDTFDEYKDKVTGHVMLAQGRIATLQTKMPCCHLVFNYLPQVEIDKRLNSETQVQVQSI